MKHPVFRFVFEPRFSLREAELTLQLAILAAEGPHGVARVRMDATYCVDAPKRTITVDGSTPVGDTVVSIYTSFLERELGADGFSVRRVQDAADWEQSPASAGHAAKRGMAG